jgi:hypothetical protein
LKPLVFNNQCVLPSLFVFFLLQLKTDVFAIFGTDLQDFEGIFFDRNNCYFPFELFSGKTAQADLTGSNGNKFFYISEN